MLEFEPVVIKRVFPCSKRRLFDAWSQPDLMAQWFYAGTEKRKNSTVKNSFTVGGTYELTMHGPENVDHVMFGTYKQIVRYTHISFSWTSPMATDSLVELEFRELSANRCEMTLTHSCFPSEDSRNAHNGGWTACLENLESFIQA